MTTSKRDEILIENLQDRGQFLVSQNPRSLDGQLLVQAADELEHDLAALDRIRKAMKEHAPGCTGIEDAAGLAASVDTFIEVACATAKRENWLQRVVTEMRDAAGMRNENVYPFNGVAADRVIARIKESTRE